MPNSDYLLDALDALHNQWCNILKMYKLFEKERPIVLFDIQEERIYLYPYAEYRADMNERSQLSLTEQYEAAVRENMMVVFVRDNDKKKLVSYSMPLG